MWKKILRVIEIIVGIAALAGIIAGVAQLFEKKNSHKPNGLYEAYFKRIFDAFLSTGALIVLSPVMAVVALLVRILIGSPVLYVQARPGKDEKIFKIYKFRTMTNETDENGELLPDEQRLTRFGRMLRSTSLDELPELVNIIKGDMAIVGPRPLLVKYLPYYRPEERERHRIRPGLTGYAQVHGRNEITWEEKFELDVWYARHLTFMTDIRIIFDSIKVVFSHEGVSLNALEDFDEYRKNVSYTNN